jgi:hypothetical protein
MPEAIVARILRLPGYGSTPGRPKLRLDEPLGNLRRAD